MRTKLSQKIADEIFGAQSDGKPLSRDGLECSIERVLARSNVEKAWAWIADFGLCLWAMPTKQKLVADGKPSREAKAVRVLLVRE